MRAIENEQRLYRKGEQAEQAVVKGSESWVSSTLARLDLKAPDGYIDCYTEGSTGVLEVFTCELRKSDPLAWANLLVYTPGVSVWARMMVGPAYPGIPITANNSFHNQCHRKEQLQGDNIEVNSGTSGQSLVAMFTARNNSAKMSALVRVSPID